tara:strand:- start:183 stop:2069 length:1887 start_codon:yes stop_codon:yes gene_type:complete
MAKKGYGADATLVAAGFRLGQSYVPGDYSSIFEKQYQGLIAANKAKAQAKIDVLKSIDEKVGDIMESKKEEKDWLEEETSWFDEYEKATTDYVDGKINNVSEHYENGGELNEAFSSSDEEYLRSLKEDYESLRGQIGLNEEQRNRKTKLKKEIENFRGVHNSSKASLSTSGVQWRDGLANKNLSFKGEPELQMLFGQIYDPKSNFKDLGIRAYWENGERFFEYTDGRSGAEVKSTSENPDQYDFMSESSKKKNIISEKDLLSRLKLKDIKTENDHNGVDAKVIEQVNAMTTNAAGAKLFTTKDFTTIRDKVQRQHYDVAMASTNPQDIYTRNILIGNTSRVYKDDLLSNRAIDVAVINQMGIGSDVFTAEELADNKIDPTELAKHEDAKNQIIEMLTNPKTASQKEVAATEYSKYRRDTLEGVFNAERARFEGAKKKVPPPPPPGATNPFTAGVSFKLTDQKGKLVTVTKSKDELFADRSAVLNGQPFEGAYGDYPVKNGVYMFEGEPISQYDILIQEKLKRPGDKASELGGTRIGEIDENKFNNLPGSKGTKDDVKGLLDSIEEEAVGALKTLFPNLANKFSVPFAPGSNYKITFDGKNYYTDSEDSLNKLIEELEKAKPPPPKKAK